MSTSGKGKLWTTDPTEELPINVGKEGLAAMEPTTVMAAFNERVKKTPDLHAMCVKRDGEWKKWTFQEYHDSVHTAARAMLKLGIQQHDCINVIGFNSPEWFIADMGVIACGGIAAGIYTTNGPDACKYIVNHSKAKLVFVENDHHLQKFIEVEKDLETVTHFIQWDGELQVSGEQYMSWDDFMKLGEDNKDLEEEVERRIEATRPGHAATLIYTSGTTGMPKAVMITHDNLTFTVQIIVPLGDFSTDDYPDEHVISYLPLSHVAAQMADIHLPYRVGVTVWFAQPDALKGSLGVTLKEVRPTFFLGVPRVWEKFHEKILEIGRSNGGLAKSIGAWAKGVGLQGSYNEQKGQDKPWGWWLASTLVFGKVRAALGLDRCHFCVTAAAPISRETLDYFNSLYIPIYEIYGMSECTGPETATHRRAWRTGSCGQPIPGTELKLDNPDEEGNGEICYRGRHIFMGYMYNDEATADTIDEDGWLHSGDIGKLDEDGYLKITGRKKELIITAGGENIPPVLIEAEVKKHIGEVISNIMVIGDARKFLSAVVTLRATPKVGASEDDYPFTDNLDPRVIELTGTTAKTVTEAMKDETIKEYIMNGIKEANKAATSRAQNIQKFEILPKDFSVAGDETTPTLKLKRRNVDKKYKELIDSMYDV